MKLKHISKKRIKTIPVKAGNLVIGGGAPVAVQSMWKTPLKRIHEKLISNIHDLMLQGCEILRFAVPDLETAALVARLARQVNIPLVADIHFDYKLALYCMDSAISKIRINPGNIGPMWKVAEVVKKARDKEKALRVGINSGSLPRILRKEKDKTLAMLKAAEMEMEVFTKLNFKQVIFSLKSPDVETTIRANQLFSKQYKYPLHLGVTEAGPLIPGVVKNTTALITLLKQGIGDTIRVSLSAPAEFEIKTAQEILKAAGLRDKGINIISCPTCGRTEFAVREFYEKLSPVLAEMKKNITVAIMGCPVNGLLEAKHADIGITGTGKNVLIFKKGEIIRRELIENAFNAFLEEFNKI